MMAELHKHIGHIRTWTVDPPAELSIEDKPPDISIITTRVENAPAAGPGSSPQLQCSTRIVRPPNHYVPSFFK